MPAVTMSEAQRAKVSALVPAGYDLDQLRILEVSAQAIPSDVITAEELAVVAAATKSAGAPMINKDGRPTILRVVAWMCHGDVVNRNGDLFVKEELQAQAPSLFREPNFGVMDWNHSAVFGFGEDPKIIGVWYATDFAYDQEAKAWGLLAKGMVFAWLFPEQSDSLIAEQLRNGTAKFSMACIPGSVEFRDSAAVLHNPVFFTVSALDKPPADPDARGKVSEDPTTDSAALMQELVAKEVAAALHLAATTAGTPPAPNREDSRMEEIITQLKAEKIAAETKLAELSGEKAALENKLAEAEKTAEDVAALQTKIAELEARLTEAKTAQEALGASLAAAEAKIAELETEKAALAEKLAGHEAKEAAAQAAARLAARIAELPEAYRAAHAARKDEDRAKVEARWSAMSDEQWADHKDELLVGFSTAAAKPGYVRRSEKEGSLPSSTSGDDTPMARVQRHIKR